MGCPAHCNVPVKTLHGRPFTVPFTHSYSHIKKDFSLFKTRLHNHFDLQMCFIFADMLFGEWNVLSKKQSRHIGHSEDGGKKNKE